MSRARREEMRRRPYACLVIDGTLIAFDRVAADRPFNPEIRPLPDSGRCRSG